MNPFDVHGKEFLAIYIVACLVFIILAFVVRELMKGSGGGRAKRAIKLHPYEVAYLNGGSDVVLQTVLSYLILNNVATIEQDGSNSRLKLESDPLEKLSLIHKGERKDGFDNGTDLENLRDLESELATFVNGKSWTEIGGRDFVFKNHMDRIRETLVAKGLCFSKKFEKSIKTSMIAVVLIPPLCLALPRIIETFSTHRPAGFLMALTFITLVIPFIIGTLSFRRTRAGDKYIEALKEDNQGLYQTINSSSAPVSNEDLTLACGLFGRMILLSTAFAGLTAFFAPGIAAGNLSQSATNSLESSCSFFGGCSSCGSSCGGGCGGCGGGCGGCGG